MEKLIQYLEKLGLSDIEIRLYLTLLENGPKKVKELADLAGMKRTTIYLHIDTLIEKGLAAEILFGPNKQVIATKPEQLGHLVEKQYETAVSLKKSFPDILQTIGSIKPKIKNFEEPTIKYFKGINAVKAIYEEALTSIEIRSYVKVEEKAVISSDNIVLFKNAFKNNKKLKMWEIIYESPSAKNQAIKDLSRECNYFYKFMPSGLKWSITSEDILIFDGKVVIINYKEKICSLVLNNVDFYNNSKELFDFVWRMLPNPSA